MKDEMVPSSGLAWKKYQKVTFAGPFSTHVHTKQESTHTEGSMNTAHTSLDNLCLSPLSLGILSPMSTFIHLSTAEAAFLLADST